MEPIKKLTTVNVKEMTRGELETAYKNLLKISMMKTDLIESLTGVKNDPAVKSAIESAVGVS